MASAITFTALNFTGSASADDILAAKFIIGLENARIVQINAGIIAQNVILAAQQPPGTPIPLLPILLYDTPVTMKASYLGLLLALVAKAHGSYIDQARSQTGFQAAFTEAQREQIRVNLVTRLNGGESADAIVADTTVP